MSNYTKTTDFAAKDALITGNPLKLIKGTEIGLEFDNIATAIATKPDVGSTNSWTAAQTYNNSCIKMVGSGAGVTTFTSNNAGASNYTVTFQAANGTVMYSGDLAAPGEIGGTTPGIISGLNKEVFKTANADSPLTAAQCSGTVVSNYGMTDADCTIVLPTAAAGYAFVCVLPAVRAKFFKLQAAASDKIYISGVAGSDNGKVGVASGYATGSSCSVFSFKASDGGYDWFVIPLFGSWVAS